MISTGSTVVAGTPWVLGPPDPTLGRSGKATVVIGPLIESTLAVAAKTPLLLVVMGSPSDTHKIYGVDLTSGCVVLATSSSIEITPHITLAHPTLAKAKKIRHISLGVSPVIIVGTAVSAPSARKIRSRKNSATACTVIRAQQ